jgi:hypothetical protein
LNSESFRTEYAAQELKCLYSIENGCRINADNENINGYGKDPESFPRPFSCALGHFLYFLICFNMLSRHLDRKVKVTKETLKDKKGIAE